MYSINQRIRELRKALQLSQEKFGALLGISKSGVCDIEAGRRRVTKTHILLLTTQNRCRVNEHWLLTGEGSMFQSPANLSDFPGSEPEPLIRALAEAYLELDTRERLVLVEFLHRIHDKIRRTEPSGPPSFSAQTHPETCV